MENNFSELRKKIEQLNFLYKLNSELSITSVKHERKIKLIYHNKEYLNRCLSFSSTKDQQCMNSRVLGHKFCYKHTDVETNVKLYEDEYDFIFNHLSTVIDYPYNNFIKQQNQNKHTILMFEIASFDEFNKYSDHFVNDNLLSLSIALCKDFPKQKEDIQLFCMKHYNFNPLKTKVIQDLSKIPLNEKKCFARISTGRQCINNRWNENGELLEYCNLHRKSTPHGDFRDISTITTKYKKKEIEIVNYSLEEGKKIIRPIFENGILFSILGKTYKLQENSSLVVT